MLDFPTRKIQPKSTPPNAGTKHLIPQNEIDLSVGGTYILTGIVAALLMRGGMNPTLAILLSLLVAMLVDLLSALTSQIIGIPSLIVTLAMSWMLRGLKQSGKGEVTPQEQIV